MIDFDDMRREVDAREEWFTELLQARRKRAGYPAGALGSMEHIAEWFVAARRTQDVEDFSRPRLIVFAAEHGIAEADLSAFPVDGTAALVAEIEAGGGPIPALAELAGATVRVVWAGDGPSARADRAEALTEDEADAAVRLGIRIADEEIDAGADLLMPAGIGVGASTIAAALTGVILQSDPSVVTGRGSGIDDAAWMRKVMVVRDTMRRGRPYYAEPAELLRRCGGADINAIVGFVLQASIRRTPVLLDGVVTTAAALLARDLAWSATNWWLASCRSSEPAYSAALDAMALEPLLDADIRIGGGASALTALPVLRAALRGVGAILVGVEPEPEGAEEDEQPVAEDTETAADEGEYQAEGDSPEDQTEDQTEDQAEDQTEDQDGDQAAADAPDPLAGFEDFNEPEQTPEPGDPVDPVGTEEPGPR